MQGTWFPSLVWELRSHILSASTSLLLDCHPVSSSWPSCGSGEGVKKLPGWLMGPPNRCHPLGAGVLDHRHQQTSLTLWGPCSEVSVSRTPRCTSSSWNNLWLGPISPLSLTSFITQFCISFWVGLLGSVFSHTLDPVTPNVLLLSDLAASHLHA